jgi:uncharacterized membrane protein YciS (DUF1049 family)
MQAIFLLILVIILLIVTMAFGSLNDGMISVNFFVIEKQLPLTYLLLISFIIGGLMATLIYIGQYLKMKMQIRRLKKTTELQTQELANLRALPVKDPY